jgi:molybdopterin-guanine dinucleotide biosynthesis protein A
VGLLRLLAGLCNQPIDQSDVQSGEPWDAVIPMVDGRAQTLCAAYHRRCLPFIQTMLRQENYRIRDLYSLVRVRTVPEDELRAVDPTLQSFTNANTPQEWAAIRQMLAAR